jgi:hypothetical protein
MTPSARATHDLSDLGYIPWTVERKITPIITRDLYNVIDILALHPDGTCMAVQVTSGNNHASRATKVRESQYLDLMLGAGWVVEVWSYKGDTLRRERINNQPEKP